MVFSLKFNHNNLKRRAIYFINMYSGLSLLIESGKTREIPLFGVFEGCLIFGIVGICNAFFVGC